MDNRKSRKKRCLHLTLCAWIIQSLRATKRCISKRRGNILEFLKTIQLGCQCLKILRGGAIGTSSTPKRKRRGKSKCIRQLRIDEEAAKVFKKLLIQLKSKKRYADMMIAAMALAGNHIVVTRNTKHFADLLPPDQLANWIDEPPQ